MPPPPTQTVRKPRWISVDALRQIKKLDNRVTRIERQLMIIFELLTKLENRPT